VASILPKKLPVPPFFFSSKKRTKLPNEAFQKTTFFGRLRLGASRSFPFFSPKKKEEIEDFFG
jgi:hypothetical protein